MIELPELSEVQEQWPTLASMAIMETLLSLDNLMAVSKVAAHLPPNKRNFALAVGALCSYALRVVALLVTAPLISSYAVAKILGSLYMIHLMASHFTAPKGSAESSRVTEWSFGKTLSMVLLVDFILNTDNIVAAVSMSKHIWVVCSSVVFGIIFVRLLGGVTIRAIRRFPVLSDSVYVLVGWIGVLLMAETVTKTLKIAHLTDIQKFMALIEILLVTLIYDSMPLLQRVVGPLLQRVCLPVLRLINAPLSILFWPIRKLTALAS
jgi:predicted tellurium resistance membrane protein TerC